jgi:hypothetical protein
VISLDGARLSGMLFTSRSASCCTHPFIDHSDYDPASEYDHVMNRLPFLCMNSRIGSHSRPVPGLPNHYLVYTIGDETVVGERIERFRHGETLVLGREHDEVLVSHSKRQESSSS